VAPGKRSVELRRPGYFDARREIALDDGARGELAFDLLEDAGAAARRGRLALAVSEPDPDVTVDGRPLGAYRDPLPLPPGLHDLRVGPGRVRDSGADRRRPRGGRRRGAVTLVPTPETRAAYKQRVELRRTWGWAGALAAARWPPPARRRSR
jgi:hypothetical protein